MSSASGSPKRIPDDFDPFAMPSSAPRNTDDPLRDLAAASVDLSAVDAQAKPNSLLDFELEPKAKTGDLVRGGTPSLVDSHQVVDPLRLFGDADNALLHGSPATPVMQGLPMRDDIPEIGAHYTPPRPLPETPLQPPMARGSSPERGLPAMPPPIVPPSSVAHSVRDAPAVAPAPHARPVPPPSAVSAPSDGPTARANAAPVAAAQQRAPAVGSAPNPDLDALLAAFLKGARITDMTAPLRLTPALMELVGSIAYHATAGAMELIAARQITKREIRAEVTMIVADDNNPLKFLPTPEAAIMQMLGPRMPGFMKGGEAMRDAFDDLRAHEVGVIAGMRAALADVLQRFDPALLQSRLGESGLVDALLPAARRARLWDLFEARFQELYREANDDFQSLFGEAFTRAYEEQIQLDRARRRQP
jgi:FHA domain-containing protein